MYYFLYNVSGLPNFLEEIHLKNTFTQINFYVVLRAIFI